MSQVIIAISMFCNHSPLPGNATFITPAQCEKTITMCVLKEGREDAQVSLKNCLESYLK